MLGTIGDLIAFFGGYLLQAAIVFGVIAVIVIPGLLLLLAIRAVWRRIAPYEPPEFGAVPTLRDRLERL